MFKRNPASSDIDENDTIDPQLRLRTVRTAASTIAESIRSEIKAAKRRNVNQKRSLFFRKKPKTTESVPSVGPSEAPSAPQSRIQGARRNVYVNQPLSAMEADQYGEPLARYARNKVRTSRYTLLTFLPKNLFEQFHRIANIYFLALVVFQLFPVFGAASAQTAALPLLFILVVTAVKDGVEDYRRAQLDEEVNTSAVTRLGEWRNINQAIDPRPWYQRLLHINAPGKITRGVQKLREKEAGEGKQIILSKGSEGRGSMSTTDMNDSITALGGSHPPTGAGGRELEDIEGSINLETHTYPPGLPGRRAWRLGSAQYQSIPSRSSLGVVDWSRRTNGTARWERTLWKKLEVGDIVLLREDEQVPADVVVLSTSDADGLCYLETKNLDGETNLKVRKALHATSSLSSEEDIEKSSFVLDSEPPHQNLYIYNGVLRYTDAATGESRREAVSINELLLRGCTVRNTAWIIGLVVFTGPDTKIYLNGGRTPSKQSKIAKETNFNVIVNFIFLVTICSISAIINGVMDGLTTTSTYIYEQGVESSSSNVLNALVTFVSCLIAFQNIVPVSLFISIEIVKTIQAYFIAQDLDMYYKPFNTACVPKNWGISDDLGQIEYIFSDKTGTLTQNVMEFQKCSVHGVIYGEGVTEAQRGAATREGRADAVEPEELAEKLTALKDTMVAKLTKLFKNRYMQVNKLTLVSPKLADDLADRSTEQYSHIVAFFRALAVCHSVLADKPEPQERPYHLEYKAESPDEAALVAAARDVGFPFVGKHKDTIDIEVLGQPERFTHMKTLEFTSTRKRMSVIVRAPDGHIILYCKGADSVIYERLAANVDPALKEKTTKDMDFFANGGLRTLCIGYRVLAEEEFLQWLRKYEAAQSTIDNRDEAIESAAAELEHSLQILGATALEDKLQEGVPEAIEMLHRAGIKLWILTGDKLQTAIEIGFSCNLLKQDMEVMILSADTPEGTLAQIEAGLNKMASMLGPPTSKTVERGFVPGTKASFAVVIDGDTLHHALTPAIKPLFLNLGTQCETVVCCRVSPAQKALTVKLVKEGRKAMTLSIGDGANDVAMIQEANVGCGLLGHEGSQAAMSADYAFGQFRFLTKLLLVHGRWSYQRIADMHSNFFYKNVIWTLAMFWFMPFCYFDATYLYDYSFILFYNLIFTSLPVIVLGSFDQDINAKAALAFPQLYVRGIRGLEYTRTKFWFYMLDGLYQSAVVFFIPYLVWQLGLAVSYNGKGIDSLADFGTTVAIAAIFAANTYVGMNTHYWTYITWIVVIGSSLVMILWIVIYSVLPVNTFFSSTDGFIDEVEILFSNVTFWATVVFSVLVALAPRFLIKFFKSTYMPLDKDIVREMWVGGDLKDRLGIRHRKELKNKRVVDLETAPMFREPHARSASELALQQVYEPTAARSLAGSDASGKSPDDNSAELVPQHPFSHSPNSHSLSPEPPVPKLDYSRHAYSPSAKAESYELQVRHPSPPSRDWSQSPSGLQKPTHPHPSAPGQEPLVQLQPEPFHDPDAGEGRYRPKESDREDHGDISWDGPRVL
ncbi:phospholipid-transporting ATPase 1 [Suillus paluster]|uniref:phospholipid-transporting ATPase 1 n=2 Tax=Suillus paluster TaxID=48578 RepID=UPI001B8783D7|nr:phospholipid-transporting ATPase 1 [Suillus paluster]KAG1725617.1 phospholipid-transporting ATPase 1 [Suillus paluster]